MKKIVKDILRFIRDGFNFLIFLMQVLLQGAYKNKIENKFDGTVAVLANGPSLKEELPKLNNHREFENVDFIVLNFFAFEETFFKIKPKHYCLADPMFFQDSHRKEDVQKLFMILEEHIDWNLSIYVPSSLLQNFLEYSKLKNKRLTIIKINQLGYRGFERFRHFFYRSGLAIPRIQTVANLAIFIALNSGYTKVKLYGVDHTFFENLQVNNENQLCSVERHFYDNGISTLKPLVRNDNDDYWKISGYLEALMHMFKSHDQLNEYGKHLKVSILNCTSSSMIDSYEREIK